MSGNEKSRIGIKNLTCQAATGRAVPRLPQSRGHEMKKIIAALTVVSMAGCASFQEGPKSRETELRKFESVAGKTSLYVCRESALLVARGVSSVVFVDNEPIGTVKPNTFVHTLLEPGKHGVLLRHDGLGSGAGGFMTFDTKPGDVKFLWVGVTGKGFGVLTIDNFDTEADAKLCVSGATYSIKAP